MVWRPDEASCPQSARGTATGRTEAGNRRQGEAADAPQTARSSFLGEEHRLRTPQSSALEKTTRMEGLDGRGEVRKVKAETICVPSLGWHGARKCRMNDTQLSLWRKGQGCLREWIVHHGEKDRRDQPLSQRCLDGGGRARSQVLSLLFSCLNVNRV